MSIEKLEYLRQGEEASKEASNMNSSSSVPTPSDFVCLLTKSVMEDPVQIETGETFEREAIQKWFSEGNITSPLSKDPLSGFSLTPDDGLKKSIEQWKKHNLAVEVEFSQKKLGSAVESEIEAGLLQVFRLCEKEQHKVWMGEDGAIFSSLVPILRFSSRSLRRKTLATLSTLAVANDHNKLAIATAGAIPLAVRSLGRDVGESRQAVALLLELAKSASLREEIGKAQGCIVLLVTMLTSENESAAKDARDILEQLSESDQNVVHMAEANHFRPLAVQLTSGSDMKRVVMASALSRIQLSDRSNAALAKEADIVPPLVAMISAGKLEAKVAALGALQNLSTIPANRDVLLKAGIVPPILQLLFSVTSVVMSLKDSSSFIIANLATADLRSNVLKVPEADALGSEETIFHLLSLLNLAGPVIQSNLLRALYGLSIDAEGAVVRKQMRVGGAVTVLMPFLDTTSNEQALGVRTNASRLLAMLCREDAGREVSDNLIDADGMWLKALVKILSGKEDHEEKAVAAGLLAALPVDDRRVTEAFFEAGVVPCIVSMLKIRTITGSLRDVLLEEATGALIRFTLPTKISMQLAVAQLGAIPPLVNILLTGTSSAKARAAVCLDNLSQSSLNLSAPVKAKGGMFCFKPPATKCAVHGGECFVSTSFCLIEADAVDPLVAVLSDRDTDAQEAALSALSTLLSEEGRWEAGVQILHESNAFSAVVQMLTSGNERMKSKAVWVLEKLFRLDEFKFQYGAKAQGALVQLTQHGSMECRPVAAKILSHLDVLQHQSSYF